MAVMIDEMQVDVADTTPRAAPGGPAPAADPRKNVNLTEAFELLRERALRLQAD